MTTLLNHKTTLEYLAYLGYPHTPTTSRTSSLSITRPRKAERRKGKSTRGVLLCYVCGAAGSGKTSLLRAFIGRKFSEVYDPTKKMNSVVNVVEIEGVEKTLVVSPVPLIYEFGPANRSRSCKNLGRGMRRKRSKVQRRQIWRTSSYTCTILAIRTPSHTSVISE